VGPEYLALALTAGISALSGGTWVANKILARAQERTTVLHNMLRAQENRLDSLENQVNRMPLEYVLKVDFLREIQEMHDNFKQINIKLDKLMEKLLSK
jgi:microcompartment protein CcmL/EutN